MISAASKSPTLRKTATAKTAKTKAKSKPVKEPEPEEEEGEGTSLSKPFRVVVVGIGFFIGRGGRGQCKMTLLYTVCTFRIITNNWPAFYCSSAKTLRAAQCSVLRHWVTIKLLDLGL